MGVFKRYRDAQAAQKDAENAMPGAYQSRYTDRINEALDSMGAASNAGYDVGTDSELYRQYRAGAQANARAAAENAAAGAAALSGGYGSSYAGSVARQGYQQAMANVDSGLAGLRDKALTMYQLKQNGLSGLLSALQAQDSLEAAEHQGAVANAQDWRDYKKSRADQAAQEKNDFLSNLWEMAKNIGKAGLTAYDTYKGYTQQKWENDFAREQWEYNKNRTEKSDAVSGYNDAFDLYGEGATDAAKAVLSLYGLDTSAFDNYSGAPITRADKAGALTTAAGLAGGGSDEAARAVLELYGLDPNSVGNYRTIAGRQLATALATKSAGSSGSSSGRRSSGTKSSGSSWTNSQLLTALGKYQALSDDDPTKNIYAGILQEGGLLDALAGGSAGSAAGGNTGSGAQHPTRKAAETAAPHIPTRADTMRQGQARSLAVGWKKQGYSDDDVIDRLMKKGYSDEDIYNALNLK